MVTILIFGGSTTYGKCDPDGGWAGRLRKYIDQNAKNIDSNSIFNLGISGDTTEDVLRRFEFETKHRIKEDEEPIFIFSIGINDTQFLHDKQDTRISPDKFRKNLMNLIQMARKFSSKIVFLGFQPVDESRTDPWKPNKSYKMEYLEKYDKILKEVCKETGTHFIDILPTLRQGDYKSILYDGLHPTSEGHKKIFELVRDFLIKQKLIQVGTI
jgi:lysophospholipase L1-like esterase